MIGIDVLRGAAALAVFFCHIMQYWLPDAVVPFKLRPLFEAGAHGVDLFIVVSGFCLAFPLVARTAPLDAITFYRRRAWRLLPPYYVALAGAAVLAVVPATARLVVAQPAGAGDIAGHVLLAQTLLPDTLGRINGSLWSISLEAQLYLVFPLAVLAWRRWGAASLWLATAMLCAMWVAVPTSAPWVLGDIGVLPARLVQFCGGMWAAERVLTGRVPARLTTTMATSAGLALALVASSADYHRIAPLVWMVPGVGLVFLLSSISLPGGLRPVAAFGAVSYSFYLLHQPLQLLLRPVAEAMSTQPLVLLALGCGPAVVVVTVVAVLFHRLVELPSQARSKRAAAPRAPAGPVATPVPVGT